MEVKDEVYRGLCFMRYLDIKCLEVIIDNKNFYDEISCINSLCIISEFVSSEDIRYILFNKLPSDFEANIELHTFIKEVIFKQLKSSGVSKVFFLVKPNMKAACNNNFFDSDGFMISLSRYNDVFDWIKNDINRNILKTLQNQS